MVRWHRLAFAVAAIVGITLAAPGAPATPAPTAGVASNPPLVGATSTDWPWFDQAIGPVQIYRNFDVGFQYKTWASSKAYQLHPNAKNFDYSTEIDPKRILNPSDPVNAQLRAFIATTPKNIIFTNLHEPDHAYPGYFTAAQFRASILKVAAMVREQNAVDGGTRMTSVILMDVTFDVWGDTRADLWWPTDARDGGHVDIIEGDMYALPHATRTACCPDGYTDGINWRKVPYTLDPLRKFAQANNTRWAIAEFGYLEDVNDPMRKANALRDAVDYSIQWGAHHIEYFDAAGTRASWKLRYSRPIGTTSMTSNAAGMWKSQVARGVALQK
jgi:hypothetical protein